MAKEAWVAISNAYRCIDCGEPFVSLFISYGEPAVYEYPLLCPVHWRRDFKNAVKLVVKMVRDERVGELIAQLLDFIEAR
jgi:hypothetical protein